MANSAQRTTTWTQQAQVTSLLVDLYIGPFETPSHESCSRSAFLAKGLFNPRSIQLCSSDGSLCPAPSQEGDSPCVLARRKTEAGTTVLVSELPVASGGQTPLPRL